MTGESGVRYALLFYSPPSTEIPPDRREQVLSDMLAEMRAWIAELQRAGAFVTSLRLAGVETATSLRAERGAVRASDGPFAETKEMLGGLAVLECADREEALRWARACPLVRIGTIEVRSEAGPRG